MRSLARILGPPNQPGEPLAIDDTVGNAIAEQWRDYPAFIADSPTIQAEIRRRPLTESKSVSNEAIAAGPTSNAAAAR